MLNLFRTNQLILGVFLLVYALLLRFWLLFAAGPVQENPGYVLFTAWCWEQLNGIHWLPSLATTIVLWIQALLINSLIARHRIATEINLFPGLFYILVASALPVFQEFSPIHLANTFIILAVGQLFRVYRENSCMDWLFNAGLYVGVAGLFYSPYILFLIPILFGLNILRAFQLREWGSVLIGGTLPLLWLVIAGYLTDRLPEYWAAWAGGIAFVDLRDQPLGISEMIGIGLMSLLVLIVLLSQNAHLQKMIIEVRKKINIFYWLLLTGLLVTMCSAGAGLDNWLTISVPCGILLSLSFTRMSRASAELLHLFLLIGVLSLHYLTYAGVI